MFSILSIVASVLGWVGKLLSLLGRRAAEKQGAAAQAAKETTQTAVAETAIAQAEAQAPRTIDDVIAREKEGTF